MAMVSVTLAQLHSLVVSTLTSNGLPAKAATIIADVVKDAERDGCASHGIFRVPGFVHALRSNEHAFWREPLVTDAAPGLVTVDAFGGFAAPAFAAGRQQLVEKARKQGVACMALSQTRHFSALWWEVEALARDHGLVSLAFVNTAAFVAHGIGGRAPVYGTNPMAFGCPRPFGQPPLVFDQATAAMARGEMQLLLKAGLKLPAGVAIDADGIPTQDPALGLRGAQLPAAGHKGANLAMLVEVLAGGLTASPFAPEARRALDQLQSQGDLPLGGAPTVNGELIIALDPACFGHHSAESEREERLAAFTSRVESFLDILVASGAQGASGAFNSPGESKFGISPDFRLPGERRQAKRAECEARGNMVDIDPELLALITETLGGGSIHEAKEK